MGENQNFFLLSFLGLKGNSSMVLTRIFSRFWSKEKCVTWKRLRKKNLGLVIFPVKKQNVKLRWRDLVCTVENAEASWKVAWFTEHLLLWRFKCSEHHATLQEAKSGPYFLLWLVKREFPVDGTLNLKTLSKMIISLYALIIQERGWEGQIGKLE